MADTLDVPAFIEIRDLILAGRVDDAIDLLNKYFPVVLSTTSPIPTSPSPGDSDETFIYASETSMVPGHLLLNLRVQAFIEACRTRPLEIPPHKVSRSVSGTSDVLTDTPMDISDDSFHSPSPYSSSSSQSSTNRTEPQYGDITPARLASLLHKGQKLYGLAAALPNSKDKDVYQRELANVGGLLAYPVPEDSPVSKYLSYERREALADQINRAILCTLSCSVLLKKVALTTDIYRPQWAVSDIRHRTLNEIHDGIMANCSIARCKGTVWRMHTTNPFQATDAGCWHKT